MSIKDDLLKRIDRDVQRKKDLSKEVSREKSIARWAAEFFSEVDKTKNVDPSGIFAQLALTRLSSNIRGLDRKAYVSYFKETEAQEAKVEIHWSNLYIMQHNCEPVMVFDASSAFFQDALERT